MKDEIKELLKLFKKYFVDKNALVLIATTNEEIAKNIATRTLCLENGVITKEIK